MLSVDPPHGCHNKVVNYLLTRKRRREGSTRERPLCTVILVISYVLRTRPSYPEYNQLVSSLVFKDKTYNDPYGLLILYGYSVSPRTPEIQPLNSVKDRLLLSLLTIRVTYDVSFLSLHFIPSGSLFWSSLQLRSTSFRNLTFVVP